MNKNQTGLMIGPSTGWLYAIDIYSLSQQEKILKTAGANSLEIALSGWADDDKRLLSLKRSKTFGKKSFVHRSVHLPDINGQEPEHQLAVAQEVIARCNATVALFHPLKVKGDYLIGCYEKMISADIPLAIENMDSRKDSGFNLSELERLVKVVGCRFVLDVQHAYEHDMEMRYAADLFESLKDELTHFHVSGETADNIHSLLYKARNTSRIVEFLGRVLSIKNVPLILEGEYATAVELREEIEFLKKELS